MLSQAKENCVVWEEGKDSVLDRGGADLEVCVFKNKMAVAEQLAELEAFGFAFESFLGDVKGGVTDEKLLDEDFDD